MVTAQDKALAKFEADFAKKFGEGVMVTPEIKPYEVISTGSLALDYRTGVGGLVKGRITEYWGPDGTGKSTLAILAAVEAQAACPKQLVAWVDAEHSADIPWMKAHGLDIDRTKIITPYSAEDVADQVKECIRSGLFSLVVVDSLGAMITEKEKEKAADEATVAGNAKIVTRMVNIAAGECDRNGTILLLINQVRANLAYGASTTTGGGFALKHVTTMKMKFARTSTSKFMERIDGEDMVVGHELRIKLERNRVARPEREATLVLFNQNCKLGPIGIDRADEAVTLGLSLGIIEQTGAWYTPPGGEKVNGKPALVDQVRNTPGMIETIREKVLATNAGEVIIDEAIQLEDEE